MVMNLSLQSYIHRLSRCFCDLLQTIYVVPFIFLLSQQLPVARALGRRVSDYTKSGPAHTYFLTAD